MSGVKGRSGRQGSYAKQLSKALNLIDRDMPLLIEKLIEKAVDGDREALMYLIDRRLGKPKATTELDLGDNIGANLLVQLFTRLEAKDTPLLKEGSYAIKQEGKQEEDETG